MAIGHQLHVFLKGRLLDTYSLQLGMQVALRLQVLFDLLQVSLHAGGVHAKRVDASSPQKSEDHGRDGPQGVRLGQRRDHA